jgi:prepilin-type N-terminal cleavage/methylation domain-containing protein/prepilin-type processing-associated H-X9-DG protein
LHFGFSLTELLVVIAIIGVLMSLLFPAVQSVRETARRNQCASNMRQLGLAALSFHSAQSSFPPGRQGDPTTANTWGFIVPLLPFLDKNTLFKKIDLTQPATDPANAIVPVAPLPILRCPSDTNMLDNSTDYPAFAGWTRNNYRGNAGNDTGALDSGGNETNNGVFRTNQRISIDQITDGTSATALFSEGVTGDGDNNVITSPGDWFVVAPPSSSRTDLYAALQSVTPSVGSNNQVSCAGAAFVYGNYFDSRYNHLMPPNGPSGVVSNGLDPFTDVNNGAQATTASSLHPGGVNLVLADGSVRFVKSAIDIQVWWGLGSVAGGETNYDDR